MPPGDDDNAWVSATLQRHLAAVDACYACALVEQPLLEGRERYRLVFADDGLVRATALAASDLHDEALSRCVAGALARVHFAGRAGGSLVTVTVPIVYAPSRGASFARD